MIPQSVVAWYRSARRDLPWRDTRDPYAIWVSEIMLQQTRVATVIPYWRRWMTRFPTARALADAPLDDVLACWSGLGYYSRARNLHRGAADVVARWGGELPRNAAGLRDVPGIGDYTAGAIASIAFGERAPLVDGNVARVLARVFGVADDIKSAAGRRRMWALASDLMTGLPPDAAAGDLNQGLMELGATVCTARSPACGSCPLAAACIARRDGRQAELPVVPPRRREADLPLIARTALWIVDDERRIALARRRLGGLFGGLWELPQGDDVGAAASEIGVTVDAIGDVVATHRQVLSHRRLTIDVVPARIAGRLVLAAESGYDAVTWHSPHAAPALGLASSTIAILALDKDPSWSSTPRPWPCSRKATRRSSPDSRSSDTTPPTRTSRPRRAARPRRSTSSSTTRSR